MSKIHWECGSDIQCLIILWISGREAKTRYLPSRPIVVYHPYTWKHYSQYNNNNKVLASDIPSHILRFPPLGMHACMQLFSWTYQLGRCVAAQYSSSQEHRCSDASSRLFSCRIMSHILNIVQYSLDIWILLLQIYQTLCWSRTNTK